VTLNQLSIFPFLLLAFLGLAFSAPAQRPVFKVEGTVHGYEYNPGQGLLKKSKVTLLEGTLEGASISIAENSRTIQQLITNDKGFFEFELRFDALYQLTIFKKGYNYHQLIIDTRAFPPEIKAGGFAFKGAEFVLNSYKSGNDSSLHKNLGRLYYNPPLQQFSLSSKSQQEPTGLFVSPPPFDTPAELLQRAIRKNNKQLLEYKPLERKRLPQTRNRHRSPVEKSNPEQSSDSDQDTIQSIKSPEHETSLIDADSNLLVWQKPLLSEIEAYIQKREEGIGMVKEQLEMDRLKARSHEDSLQIAAREQQIGQAIEEIAHARLLINAQNEELVKQRNSLYLAISLLLLSAGLLLSTFSYYRQKQKTAQLIVSKNRQITDSISYARKIQQSILISEHKLCEYLPESFVFWQPKAIVSGDFYFIAKCGPKYLVAAADCTGHGVPGAFMSLIGHRLLREIVVEKHNYDPASVLEQLHSGIIDSLQQDEGQEYTQDGMDIAVCLIDPREKSLVYAGAMNPAYLLGRQEIQVLQADIRSVGGKSLRPMSKDHSFKFTNKHVSYSPGSMLYLFTDGYMDQFGGKDDRKFNTKRYKQLLLDICLLPAPQQKEIIHHTFQDWKQEYPQTDDVLLLGIRLS
jgi:serine phosphatase RsbU (regulator of sigma subunit)